MEVVEKAAPPCCINNNNNNNNNDHHPVAKGKRTKRQRPNSPIPSFTIADPTSAGEHDTTTNHLPSPTFSAVSSEESTTTEEKDTAECLILLAQGHSLRNNTTTTSKTATASGGACMFACKTCDRVFPSFQALGGHRASHKKPKNDKKYSPKLIFNFDEEDDLNISSSKKLRLMQPHNPPSLPHSHLSSGGPKPFPNSPRIHECSYCGAEFTSGQALGGHMRRHRAGTISPAAAANTPAAASIYEADEAKDNRRNGLSLDLNLPAPENENQRINWRQQKGPPQPEKLVLSTTDPTLVDCLIN